MSSQDIPGYYYDAEKKKYFKISKQDLPDFVSNRFVIGRNISEEINQTIQTLQGLCRPEKFNLLNELLLREYKSFSSHETLHSSLAHACLKYLQLKFHRRDIGGVLGKGLLSPDCRYLYCILTHYSLSHFLVAFDLSRIKGKGGLTSKSGPISNCLQICEHPFDLTWLIPGRRMLILGHSGVPLVQHVSCNGRHCEIFQTESINFRLDVNSHFVTPKQTSQFDIEPSSTRFPVAITRHEYVCCGEVASTVRNLLPHLRRRKRNCRVTASAYTTDSLYPDVRMYVAYKDGREHTMSLIDLNRQTLSPLEFHLRHSLTAGVTSQADLAVTFLQSLNSPNGSRAGVLVGRRCGLLQLWDDRWPIDPVIEYPGSCGGPVACQSASPTPLCPTISPIEWNIVASPLLASRDIALWDLKTGVPITVIRPPSSASSVIPERPPYIYFRSSGVDHHLQQGPTLLITEQDNVYCFFQNRFRHL